MTKKNAFTLAEVLITLVVLGLIASMTIPTLMSSNNRYQNIVALKKAYSVLSEAHNLAVAQNGSPENWMKPTAHSRPNWNAFFAELYPQNLKVSKICNSEAGLGCFPKGMTYKTLNGTNSSIIDDDTSMNVFKLRLADGSSWNFLIYSTNCTSNIGANSLTNVCGTVDVDVNGDKGPNQYGVDFFSFWITKSGIVPLGTEDDNYAGISDCNTSTGTGLGCAAWVIFRGNMDYLDGKALNW